MASVHSAQLSPLAADVVSGLLSGSQKKLPPKYFYDNLGTKLFEAITLLPEYGLTRADARVLEQCARRVAEELGSPSLVAELGSGTGKKISHVLRAIKQPKLKYYPIDVSKEALDTCRQELAAFADIQPIEAEYLEGLGKLCRTRPENNRLLLLFVGSSIGNFEPEDRRTFLKQVHEKLRPGDLFLLGVDLVKNIDRMIAAYDDPIGVTAAFNRNVLARMNRELEANFELNEFAHEAVWNAHDRRIEMHLVSRRRQTVVFPVLGSSIHFEEGESIWTESSHKFTNEELREAAHSSGFQIVETWIDSEWEFAEALWRA